MTRYGAPRAALASIAARRGLVAAALAVALTGCGNTGLSPADRLQNGLADVVDAANSADLPGLRSSLATLRATVRSELGAQQITPAKAADLLAALAAVERDADLVAPPTTPTRTSPPAPVNLSAFESRLETMRSI